jgi:pimeloyl-ACP methyl ester carboxylesterase
MGFSGGGAYALATAALLPDVVTAVCVLATLGPYGAPGLDWLDGMDDSYLEDARRAWNRRS